MIKTLAIAAFASTLALAAPISSAEAKTNINIDFGLNLGGGYYAPGYSPYPVYSPVPVYTNYCGEARMNVKYHGFNKVKAVDCSGPTFAFKARKNGHWWLVRTNVHGNIKSVQSL
jgi:hypothetical protein